jgi:hypothetical protein
VNCCICFSCCGLSGHLPQHEIARPDSLDVLVLMLKIQNSLRPGDQQQEEPEEQSDQDDEQSSEDGDSSEGNNNGDSQSDNYV